MNSGLRLRVLVGIFIISTIAEVIVILAYSQARWLLSFFQTMYEQMTHGFSMGTPLSSPVPEFSVGGPLSPNRLVSTSNSGMQYLRWTPLGTCSIKDVGEFWLLDQDLTFWKLVLII